MKELGKHGQVLTYGDLSEELYCNVCDEQIDDGCLAIGDWAYICKNCLDESVTKIEE